MSDPHQLVRNTYNTIAKKYHQCYGRQSEFFLKFSKAFMKLLPEKAKILDLGCGPGRDAKYFSKKGYEVVGVDFSEKMLQIAREIAPKAKFLKQDLRRVKLPINSFDGIWCFFVLLHLKRKEVFQLLKRIQLILKRNGILFIATKYGRGEIIEKEHLDESLKMFETYFQRDEIEQLIRDAGFELLMTDLGYSRYGSDEKNIVVFAKKIY